MNRVFHRLDVYIHGDWLHSQRKVEIVYKERMDREISWNKVETPDHLRPDITRTRENRNIANPSPNAPLLKRVVKTPPTLEKSYFSRFEIPRMKLEGREAIVFPKIVQEELIKDKKIRKIRPMEYHIIAKTEKIPSVEQWLESKKQSIKRKHVDSTFGESNP